MNLRVDLILDTEKRSGSAVSMKSAIRIAVVFVPICIVVFVLVTLLNISRLTAKAERLEASWADAQEKQTEAVALSGRFSKNRELASEINGWKESHADWHDDLIAMLKIIPETIHLRHLSLEHKIAIIERDQAREFTLSISGKAYGPTASADVDALKRRLGSVQPFCDHIEEIRVPIFRQDSDEDAAKTDRIFTIQCVYKPRLFKASK